MLSFIFAPDSFKGSLSAIQICKMLTIAAKRHFPQAHLRSVPVADGGEGTVEALVLATGGKMDSVEVTGPLGGKTTACFGVLPDGKTAVLEMAQASGLALVPTGKLNPLEATSRGTGEMLNHALDLGFSKLLLGIGGSATNDGGMGMLTALGALFRDREGNVLSGSGKELALVETVDLAGLHQTLQSVQIQVICDVSNPLLGENGATSIYGPQKGVTEETRDMLENGMAHYAKVLARALGRDIASFPGAGAAGGLGAALGGVLGAKMLPGISAVLDTVGFDTFLEEASLVITGEGRIDGQSIRFGKVPAGVAARCAKRKVPVIAIVGGMAEGAEALYDLAESSIFTTVNGIMPLENAMQNAPALFESAADRMFRMLKIGAQLQSPR